MKLIKTDAGQQAFNERSVKMPTRARTAFLQFDGKKTTTEIIDAVSGLTLADINQMINFGFLAPACAPSSGQEAPARAPLSEADKLQRYYQARTLAVQTTGNLGLRGFFLNMSVERTSSGEELMDLLPAIAKAAGVKAAQAIEAILIS